MRFGKQQALYFLLGSRKCRLVCLGIKGSLIKQSSGFLISQNRKVAHIFILGRNYFPPIFID